jgi:hypothetical protein
VLPEPIAALRKDPEGDEVFARMESRWARVAPPQADGDGMIVMESSSLVPFTPAFHAPNGAGRGLLIQADGLVFDSTTLSYAGCVGDSIADADRDSSGNLVVLRTGSLALFDERIIEAARYELPSAVATLAVEEGQVLLFRPDETVPEGVAIEVISIESFSVPEVGVEAVQAPPGSDFRDAFATSDDRLGFLSLDGEMVSFWSATDRAWTQRWQLPEQAVKATWSDSDATVLFGTTTRNVRRIRTDAAEAAAPVVFHPPYEITGLASFDRFILAPPHQGISVAGTSLLHSLDGEPPSDFDPPDIDPSSRDWSAWNPNSRRLYLSATTGTSFMTLDDSGAVLPPRGGSSRHGVIRLSPDGMRIAVSSGDILDADLEVIDALDREIVDLEWHNGRLATIKAVPEGSQVDRFDESYSPDQTVVVQGEPLRLFPAPSGHLAVVTSWQSAVRIYLLDPEFRPVFDSLPQAPTMTRPLHDVRVPFRSEIVVTARVEGTQPLSFQWHRNGDPLPGETSATLRIANAGSNSAGSYTVRISNAHGFIFSNPSIVSVGPVRNPRFSTGGFLVLGGDELKALDSDGRPLPDPLSDDELEPLFVSDRTGDLVVDTLGRLHVLNFRNEEPAGTWVSTWDPDTGRWNHLPHERVATASPASDSSLELGRGDLLSNVTRQNLHTGAVDALGFGELDGDFSRFSIAPEGTAHLLAFDQSWKRFSLSDGHVVGEVSLLGLGGTPDGISFAEDGGAYVTFSNGVIRHLDATGRVLSEFDAGPPHFGNPSYYIDLSFNGSNRLIATTRDQELFVMDETMSPIRTGSTPGATFESYNTWIPPMTPDGPVIEEPEFPVITRDGPGTFNFVGIDPDPDSVITWAIGEVSRPELFRVLRIEPDTGLLTYQPARWISGTSRVEVVARSSGGLVRSRTIEIEIASIPLPDPQLAQSLVFNRQTGLYEHTLTVTNTAQREIAGFDLSISGLPAGVQVFNASDCEDGTWCVQHRQPLAAGASVTLILEYYAPVRGTVIEPKVTVSLVTEPESDPAAAAPGLAVDRCEMLEDGLLIEFTATPGSLYEVQYSNDNAVWKVSPTRIRAAGNRVQWIDRGPPRTDSPPADKSSRFYRVRELPESQ